MIACGRPAREGHRHLGMGESLVKVVVTGGAGFIGSNLGRELLARPDVHEVVALDDLSTGFRSNLEGTGIRLFEGTILDPLLVAAAEHFVDGEIDRAQVREPSGG